MRRIGLVGAALALSLWPLAPAGSAERQAAASTARPWRPSAPPKAGPDGFIRIGGGTLLFSDLLMNRSGLQRVDDLEMLDHAVTNAEYREFVRATRHRSPPHWKQGRYAKGTERHPVVFVSRYDAQAYLQWRTKRDGRVHRLPTVVEFEYAARGGLDGSRYPWGDSDPKGKANFDESGDRTLAQWQRHLRPVKSYPPNGYGLYDMVGNVWNLVTENNAASEAQFKFRVEVLADIESRMAGGSWARRAAFLERGMVGSLGAGNRQPDVSFRPVREPAIATPWFHEQPRRLVAVPQGAGRVFLSWQLMLDDRDDVAFDVYRTTRRDAAGFKVNQAPIRTSTNFLDQGLTPETHYYYRVSPVVGSGASGPVSEWVGVTTTAEKSGVVVTLAPVARPGSLKHGFGDLDGDGLLDWVVRISNGIGEGDPDPGVPVELEAYTGSGRLLWRRRQIEFAPIYGSANNAPVNVYDLDGDGRAEVFGRMQEGKQVYLMVLDGRTGTPLKKTPWPAMLTDHTRSSTRIALAVAYLDGKTPSILTQTGLYENEVITAFDGKLRKLWEYQSVMETSGSGSHYLTIADLDSDGRDEVIAGTTCLNPNGTLKWSIYRHHPDIVVAKDFLPDRPGREVLYGVETYTHAGAYMVDGLTGQIIWKVNREDDMRWVHSHRGWAADIWAGSPGIECMLNRNKLRGQDLVLFSNQGKILVDPYRGGHPVEWDGDPTRELMSNDGRTVGKFNGKGVVTVPALSPGEVPAGRVVMVADVVGDFRDEIIVSVGSDETTNSIHLITPTGVIDNRAVTRTAERAYRTWLARNLIGGYGTYFEPETPRTSIQTAVR